MTGEPQVTQLDWIIVAFATILAVLGFRQGFIIGVLSFGGFALGAFLGTRLGPLLLPQGSASPYAPAFGLVGAILAGAILAGGFEGLGLRLRRALVIPGLGVLDGVLGALLGLALSLGIVWILAAVAAQTAGKGQLRADIQRSAILRKLNQVLPPSGPILNALARLDPLPAINGPTPNVASPVAGIARAPGVRAASHSVVRVVGTACGLAIEGSGWAAAPDVVVTNAHVVAGEQETTVEVGGSSPSLPAQAIAFDARDDIAVLRVPELELRPLSLAESPAAGTSGAIAGYPENGPFDAEPARIGRTQTVLTQDVYGRGPIPRLLTPLRGLVRPGNSGGPVLDSSGAVLTTVFAGTVGSSTPGGYGVADSTVATVLHEALARAQQGGHVDTGPCAPG
jgi:S1-C subfamily serine protease